MHKKEFDESLLNRVIEKLRKDNYKAFCDEAHFQMTFIKACYDLKLYKCFEFVPEYPVYSSHNWYIKKDSCYEKNTIQSDDSGSIDLLIINKKKGIKTAIEFKYLTKNIAKLGNEKNFILENPCPFIGKIEPSNMGANDQRRFDCWSDIERMERLIDSGTIDSGYLILITNDESYWNQDGTHSLLTIKENESYKPETKEWTCDEKELLQKESSFNKSRMRKIIISKSYAFKYKNYSSIKVSDNLEIKFKSLVVPIK